VPACVSCFLVLLGVALGATFALRGFYGAFHSRWPEQYFGGERGVDPVVSRSPWRYGAFRLVPVFVVLSAAGTVAARLGESRSTAIIAAVTVYVVQGPGRMAVRDWHATPRRVGLVAYRVGTVLGCVCVASVAVMVGDKVDRFVPDLDEFTMSIWAAVAVVAVAQVALSMSAPAGSRNPGRSVARARADIDPGLLVLLRDADVADPAALEAVALVEQLNRPGWVRRLERVLVRGHGTYGLMQVTSDRAVSDHDSVIAFVKWAEQVPAAVWPAEGEYDAPRRFFLAHNDDTQFANLATELYWELRNEQTSDSAIVDSEGEDGSGATPISTTGQSGAEGDRPDAVTAASLVLSGALMATGIAIILGRNRSRPPG